MKYSTHMIVSIGTFFCIFHLIYTDIVLIIILTILALAIGILPDVIDFKVIGMHRNFLTHSPLSPLFFILWFALAYLLYELQIPFYLFTGLLLALSYQIHAILDSLNPTGIPLLPGRNIRLSTIRFDDFFANLLLDLAGILMFLVPVVLY